MLNKKFMRISVLSGLFLGLITLTASCQSAKEGEPKVKVESAQMDKQLLSSAEFKDVINSNDVQLLDVRTADEYSRGHIDEARNVDFMQTEQFQADADHLDKNRPVAVYCAAGGRSQKAASYLSEKGFTVYELNGGYNSWVANQNK